MTCPETDPLMIEADRDKVDVALGNLVRNAITFTDAQGQVGLKAEQEGGFVKVFVVDTGIGIPAGAVDAHLRPLLPGRIAPDPPARRDGARPVDRQGHGRDAQRPDLG